MVETFEDMTTFSDMFDIEMGKIYQQSCNRINDAEETYEAIEEHQCRNSEEILETVNAN